MGDENGQKALRILLADEDPGALKVTAGQVRDLGHTPTEIAVSLDCNEVEQMPETGGCDAGGSGAAAGAAMGLLALVRRQRRAASARR